MGYNPRNLVIKAFADGAGGYRFETWENGSQVTNETIVFEKPLNGTKKMKKVDHHRVVFDLQDNGTGLKFADKDNAFFIDVDGGAPGKGKHLDAWWVDSRTNDKKLEVINMNLKQQRYKFTLNFLPENTPDNGGPYIEYDPIGDNRNGGTAGSFTSSALIVCGVTGFFVAAAATTLSVGFEAPTTLLYGLGGALVGAIIGFIFDRF